MASTTPGAQLIARTAAVLRAVSEGMPAGIATAEVADHAHIARSTAHRILTALGGEGFVDRRGDTGAWVLGPEMFLMGQVASERYDVTPLARESIRRLAGATGESAFFSVRRGGETVCLLREEGAFPIRSFVLHEGIRFPLGVASAGLAILAFLDAPAIDDHLATADLAGRFGPQHADEPLRRRIAITRERGYAVNPGLLVEGSWGAGAAVFDRTGAPTWALSLTGIQSRFDDSRLPALGRLLMTEAHRLSREIQTAGTG